MSKGAQRQRCMATAKDGTRCGRWVTDGSNPALCHKHRPNAAAVGVIPPDEAIDEVKILKKLARDANPQVRLRAVDLLLSLKSREPERINGRQPSVDIKRLTKSERSRIEKLLLDMRAIWEEVWERDPIQRPDWAEVKIEAFPPQDHGAVPRPAPSKVEPNVAAEPEATPDASPVGVPARLWPEVGLFLQGTVVTHALGDAHAKAILDGTVSLDDARAQHAAAKRHDKSAFQRS